MDHDSMEPQDISGDAAEIARTFDHRSASYAADPHRLLSILREACPVARSEKYRGFWVITGYDEVAQVARDDVTFSSEFRPNSPRRGVRPPPGLSYRYGFIDRDPPESLKIRRIINPLLSPKSVDLVVPRIREYALEALSSFASRGSAD